MALSLSILLSLYLTLSLAFSRSLSCSLFLSRTLSRALSLSFAITWLILPLLTRLVHNSIIDIVFIVSVVSPPLPILSHSALSFHSIYIISISLTGLLILNIRSSLILSLSPLLITSASLQNSRLNTTSKMKHQVFSLLFALAKQYAAWCKLIYSPVFHCKSLFATHRRMRKEKTSISICILQIADLYALETLNFGWVK